MRIAPVSWVQSHRQYVLSDLTAGEIAEALGFTPNVDDDDREKVVHSWAFRADGAECAIWDYRGSHRLGRFSAFGPRDVFLHLFGASRVN
jgi:hypothetical protein